MARTLFDKLWDMHTVCALQDNEYLLFIDRIFLHERTGSIALKSLAAAGRAVRRPRQVFCTMDHIVDTFPGRGDQTLVPGGTAFIQTTRECALEAGITLFDVHDPRQGIAHVVSAERGIALPGVTLVCPDSHTCTLGGIGALAWGIGSSDAEHALATQTLRVHRPRTMQVRVDGRLGAGVTAKDLVLFLISRHRASGGAGCAVEFCGEGIRALPVEARLTLCNMAVEFSAFTGLVAPDDATIDYVQGRPEAPGGEAWDLAVAHWRTLYSDPDARFDQRIVLDASEIAPMVSWGTSPEHAIAIDAPVPDPALENDPSRRQAMQRALQYMGLEPGQRLGGTRIDAAFIGSCTNSRLSDLRAAAEVLEGRRVADGVDAVCVPGSTQVKRLAEAEGLHRVFIDAGFEWRESGCSMCFYAGGETFGPGKRVVSTTNRNFEGRQGPGTRTHLASPATVAASACAGFLSGPSAGRSRA